MVPGRLCRVPDHAAFYRDVLKADQQVLNVVSFGYVGPFENEHPVDTITINNQSFLKNLYFALHELHRCEKLQCIKRVQDGDYWVNMPLSVVFSNKLRLVVDANRHINPYVRKCSMELDSLDDFALLVQQGNYLAMDDLDSGYWHVLLHPSQYIFFGCSILNKTAGCQEYFH